MLLRDHPLMTYHGVLNWSPTWTWIEGPQSKPPEGEVGILIWTKLGIPLRARCYLLMKHEH
jgi:hypothetical protein